MAKPQDRSYKEDFPEKIAQWIVRNGSLLDALVALRRLAEEGDDAVEAVSHIHRVLQLRLSWELWEALVDGDGGDAEALLRTVLPIEVLDKARYALWGSAWPTEPGRHLRAVS